MCTAFHVMKSVIYKCLRLDLNARKVFMLNCCYLKIVSHVILAILPNIPYQHVSTGFYFNC